MGVEDNAGRIRTEIRHAPIRNKRAIMVLFLLSMLDDVVCFACFAARGLILLANVLTTALFQLVTLILEYHLSYHLQYSAKSVSD